MIHDKFTMLHGVKITLDEHQVGAGLDRQESSPRNIDTMSTLEVSNGSTDGGLKLNDRDVGFTALVSRNGLKVGNNFEL